MADRSSYPSEQADKFLLRLPDGMRDRIARAAKTNKRSSNAEIVARLEASFDADLPPPLRERLKEDAQENGRSLNSEIIHRLVSTMALHIEDDKELLPYLQQSDVLRERAREAFLASFARTSGEAGEALGKWVQQHPTAAEAFTKIFSSG